MGKKAVGYIVSVIVGITVGVVGTAVLAQARFVRQIDKLSIDLEASRGINTRLQTANSELSEANNRLTTENRSAGATVERLNRIVTERNRQFAAELGALKGRLGGIADAAESIAIGLGEAAGDISGIVEGIERIKDFISELPID